MDEAMICYPSFLWDLDRSCKDATTVYLILEIVGNHELFWDYGCIAHNVFWSTHVVVEVEILYVHAHVAGDYVVDDTIYMEFNCSQICRGGD